MNWSRAARCWCVLAITFIASSIGLLPEVARADVAPPQVDLLLLVDQSGSMGGVPFGMPADVVTTPNDPAGLRFAAPQAAFNILGVDRLALHRDAEYRLGVISFGGPNSPLQFKADYAQVTLDLTRIAPTTPREWEATQATLGPSLSPDPWVRQRKNLGSTSFVEPFQLACEQFSRHVVNPAPKRIVILMTDGIPERPYEAVDVSAHLGQVRDVVRGCEALRSAEIHVVGLTNFTNLRYFDTVEELWWRITGAKDRVGVISNNQQLHQKVAGIIAATVPWGTRVSRKTAVGSHLDRVVFRVFKTATNDVVRFFPPGAKGADEYVRCGASVDCHENSDLTQVITVPFPRAGMWRVEVVSGRDVEVWKTEVPIDLSLDSPASLVQYGRAKIAVRLLSQQGSEWTPALDPDAHVDWSGSTFVDGSGTSVLAVVTDGDRYSFDVAPSVAGPARVRLRGTTGGFDEDGAPRQVTVFDRELALPMVVPGKLVRLRPSLSTDDGEDPTDLYQWWSLGGSFGVRPVRLVIQAIGSDGTPVRPVEVFNGVPSIIATVSGPDGEESVELPIGQERWEAVVPMEVAGRYEVSFRTPAGLRPMVAVDDAPNVVVERAEAPWRAWGVPLAFALATAFVGGVWWFGVRWVGRRRYPRLTGYVNLRVSRGHVTKAFSIPLDTSVNSQYVRATGVPGLSFEVVRLPVSQRAGASVRVVAFVPGRGGVAPWYWPWGTPRRREDLGNFPVSRQMSVRLDDGSVTVIFGDQPLERSR